MVARLAGDEFVIMLENIDDSFAPVEDNVMHVAEKVLHQLQQPYDLTQTLSYSCTPSIGVSISDENNATTVDSLIKDADDAMYAAKRAGRNTIRLNQ